MIGFFSQIVFMQPIILSALLALPIIWYILRITPPAPKTIFFPATRFLKGLVSDEQTPSKSPWWILLLRLLIAALIIIGLANPVINPAGNIPGYGAVRVIMDNSWASAQTWDFQAQTAEETIKKAARDKREIYIVTTTPTLGETKINQMGPLGEPEALSIIRGMKPNSWSADYGAFIKAIEKDRTRKPIHSIWLSHGLDEGNIRKAIKKAQSQGGLSFITPENTKLPLLLRPTKKVVSKKNSENSNIRINVDAPRNKTANIPVTVRAMAERNTIIDISSATIATSKAPETLSFDVADNLIDKITAFQISGRKGAGAIFLLDDQSKKKSVGIADIAGSESSAPLIEASYYIKRALEPYSNITIDAPEKLIEQDMAVIILPDTGAMPTETLNNLEEWVKKGGLLLRFSGANLANAVNEQFLLPVVLRSGERSLSGSLSWDEPQKIEPFEKNSPFYGLPIPDDVSITQQVLADPEQDLEGKVWAKLSDGTPLITANKEGKGLIVLIHTTANTDWSDFALSGLYVSVLKRIVQLAGKSSISVNQDFTSLAPILIMDGYGALSPAPAAVPPLSAENLDTFIPNSTNPPGIYGTGQSQYALNIGTNLPALLAPQSLPSGVIQNHYEQDYEQSIMPYILYVALILFCIDWLIMIFLVGGKQSSRLLLKRANISLFIILFASILPSHSNANESFDIKYASDFYLAYIITGDSELDSLTRRGLESLSSTLNNRTSAEPKGVVGLNPEINNLNFFPLIYWSISDQQKPYSDKAIQNIQHYLDHGGTIIFDTRDQNRSTSSMVNTSNAKTLRRITASLNIPPIIPIPNDHVLGRSFYLLDKFVGRYESGTLWVERYSSSGRDNVSSVIIGSNDWVGSWADSLGERSFSRFNRSHSARQREMSLRFGVNLVMYALTGNYKADQVHIPYILERLGK